MRNVETTLRIAPPTILSTALACFVAGFRQLRSEVLHLDELVEPLLRRELQVAMKQCHVDVAFQRLDQRVAIIFG
jgi:hypothetical protein